MKHRRSLSLISVLLFAVVSSGVLLSRCSKEQTLFTEVDAVSAGIDFRNDIHEDQTTNILTYEYTYNGAGVATGDINNDGLADIYFSGNSTPNKLYINKGEWKFADITDQSGTAGRGDWKTGVTMVDVNGDGLLDIYVCYSGNAPGEGYNKPVMRDYAPRSNQLFVNQGCEKGGIPKFVDQAKEYGLDAIGSFSTQAYFFDYDLDGDLDMLLINHANMFYSAFFNTRKLRNLRHPYFGNRLYRNDSRSDSTAQSGNKIHFTDVSDQSGIHGSGLNFGLSAAITDFNHDGWPDFYVTNDYEEQDFCYINNHDGTFREASHQMFSHLSKFGMGSDVGDINNDGMQDLLVLDMLPEQNKRQKLLKGPDEYDRYRIGVDSGYHHQYMRNTLHLNRGFASDTLPRFSEVAQMSGVGNTDWSWSPFIVDLDNDGLSDLFITNGYLRDFSNLDFMKYTSNLYQEAQAKNVSVDYLKIIQQLPQTKMQNYMFHNIDGLQFENTTAAWGLERFSVSNGASYADLDNDGDLDIVTNNLDDTPTLLRNEASTIKDHQWLRIRLIGKGANTYGVGASVRVVTDSATIFKEAYFTRGYASSLDPVIGVGIGNAKGVKSIEVTWPGGATTMVKDPKPNELITIRQDDTKPVVSHPIDFQEQMLQDVTPTSGIDFLHLENDFIDFKSQRLLFYQLSRLGGTLATGDVNGDGNDDVFFGGTAAHSGALFITGDDGTFRKSDHQPWESEKHVDDVNALLFDADGDKDLDLYVVSGGNEFPVGDPLYQDRLYVNDGKGNFTRSTSALPVETTSGSCVQAADYDHDGDLDLFVGGRQIPGNYGLIPRSYILENQSSGGVVKFVEATSRVSEVIGTIGMVTSAVWSDVDGDSWPDLIVAGEWMPVRVFSNRQGKLVARDDLAALDHTHGWWSAIAAADVDGDGDMDFLLGNAGTNLQFKASPDEPVELFAADFNLDGNIDPVLCYYIQGKSYPLATRDELLDQVAPLRKKFTSYALYSDASIGDIFPKEQLEKAYHQYADQLESVWLENINKGKSFDVRPLPPMTQVSRTSNFLVDDFAGTGKHQILVAGNFFAYKPQLGKSDASFGSLLTFDQQKLKVSPGSLSNVWLTGDIRDMAIVKLRDGSRRVVVSRNNDRPAVFRYTKATKQPQ